MNAPDREGELQEPALPQLPIEQVEEEICTLAARIAAGTCRYLELVAEFDRRDGWWRWQGIRSMADWLAWRCALTPRSAREHVRVARSLAELPEIWAEFRAGRLTYSKVRALTRIATRESEAELLELARHATAAQLERMIRAARRVSAQEAAGTHERAYCFWDWQPDGSLYLNAVLPAEEGAALLEALSAARSELSRRRWEEARAEQEEEDAAASAAREKGSGAWARAEVPETALSGSAEPGAAASEGESAGRSAGESAAQPDVPRAYRRPAMHECLAHVAEQAVARGPGRSHPSGAYQVTVHVDAARLIEGYLDPPAGASAPGDAGACHLQDGPALSSATARRVACDAALVGVAHGPNGEPLSVGRRTRAVPTALRRALEVRDRGCRFPGCEQRRHTDAHHIVHWANGGETSLSNLVLLCRRHHRLCHEGGTRSSSMRTAGRASSRPAGGRYRSPPRSGRRRRMFSGGSSREAVPILTGSGEPMNLDYCVDAVLSAVGLP